MVYLCHPSVLSAVNVCQCLMTVVVSLPAQNGDAKSARMTTNLIG